MLPLPALQPMPQAHALQELRLLSHHRHHHYPGERDSKIRVTMLSVLLLSDGGQERGGCPHNPIQTRRKTHRLSDWDLEHTFGGKRGPKFRSWGIGNPAAMDASQPCVSTICTSVYLAELSHRHCEPQKKSKKKTMTDRPGEVARHSKLKPGCSCELRVHFPGWVVFAKGALHTARSRPLQS